MQSFAFPRIALLALAASVGAGCDLLEMAGATVVVSGLVVATPEIKHEGLFAVDAKVVATAWVGRRVSATSTAAPSPVAGIPVSVRFAGQEVQLDDGEEPGFYRAESDEVPSLSYQQGAEYEFDAQLTARHGGGATAPARLGAEAMQLSPAPGEHPLLPGFKLHSRGQALEIRWDRQYGALSYVSVLRANPAKPDEPEIVFDTRPDDFEDAVRMYTQDGPTSVRIEGRHFDREGAYAVVLVTADKGSPRTNTFLGSPFLAGSGAAVLLAVP